LAQHARSLCEVLDGQYNPQTDGIKLATPSPGSPRLKKTPVRPTLSPKGERSCGKIKERKKVSDKLT
jgi:hypothetical protein